MLSSITQLLTLAAFTVHAVLGCCWHHSHSASDGGCQHPAGQAVVECGVDSDSHQHVEPQGHLNSQACLKHCHDLHSHHSAQIPTPDISVHANSPRTADVAEAGYLEAGISAAPCEHSHDCDGADCTYVRIDSASVPPAATQPLNWLAELDFRLGVLSPAGSQASNRWAYQATVPICTAPQACAVLQTWQI